MSGLRSPSAAKVSHRQRFERAPIGTLRSEPLPAGQDDQTGTSVCFKPDAEIFTVGIVFDYPTLAARLRELAYLNGGVRIVFRDERESSRTADGEAHEEIYFYEGGIKEYVAYRCGERCCIRTLFMSIPRRMAFKLKQRCSGVLMPTR